MKIICLGDSLTEGYNVDNEYCWVNLLENETTDTWINAGISGDTSGGMLIRLNTNVFIQKPDAVFWMGGDNDIMMTCSDNQAKSNLMAMLNQCVVHGVKPIIGIPIEMHNTRSNPWRTVTNMSKACEVSMNYIRWLRIFVENFHLRHVDFCEAFTKNGDNLLYQPDGMHPTIEGHRVMADAVKYSSKFHYL